MSFDTGFLTIARFRGAPIRLHWTLPIGALLFSGFRFAPVFWAAFFGLVLIHELGHATIVRRFRHRVLAIDVTGFGGLCRWSGTATPFERACIAWGGVLAQFVVLIGAVAVRLVLGPPTSFAIAEVLHVFTVTNLWLIGLNLLPVPPLDGAEAWPLVGHLRDAWRSRSRRPKRRPPASGSKQPPSSATSRSEPAPKGEVDPEIAKMLQRIAEEAGRARRGN
jgi:stage IV sporulation protein FB